MKTMNTLKNMAAAVALAIGTMAVAQAAELKATVPFDFTAGSAQVKAGTYWIEVKPGGNTIGLRNANGKRIAYVLMNIANSSPKEQGRAARLVFRRVGAHHFLGQVWTGGGNSTANETPMSGREKSLRQEVMLAGGSVGTVEIRVGAE